MSSRARDYNDSATGARSNPATQSGQAPALERTMPDGSIRLVKFDGVDGEVLVDRKISVGEIGGRPRFAFMEFL